MLILQYSIDVSLEASLICTLAPEVCEITHCSTWFVVEATLLAKVSGLLKILVNAHTKS